MKNLTTIKERIIYFIEKQGIGISKFYSDSGVSYGILTQKSKMTEDNIVRFLTKYPQVSPEWLLTGAGNMLRARQEDKPAISRVEESMAAYKVPPAKGIPLISCQAAAGFGSADFAIMENDVKEYYVVPKFKYCKVDFMIELTGSSMQPKFNSGDIVACTILRDSKFMQWNKCHIIATREQGLLCKRLLKSEDDDYLTAVSENKDYPPFDIPKDEITGIALVCGVIRLE